MTTLPSPARTLRRDAANNRERLLAAATSVVAELGPDAGVEEIARVACVGVGTFYRHFASKDALLDELATQLIEGVVEAAETALSEHGGRGLEHCLWRICELQEEHRGCHLRVWTRLVPDRQVEQVRRALSQLLEQAQRDGVIRRDVTLEDVSLLILSIGMIIERTSSKSRTAWRRCLDLAIAGLRTAPEPLGTTPLTRSELVEIRQLKH